MSEELQNHRLDKIDLSIAELRELVIKLSDKRKAEIMSMEERLRSLESKMVVLQGQIRVWQFITLTFAPVIAGVTFFLAGVLQ